MRAVAARPRRWVTRGPRRRAFSARAGRDAREQQPRRQAAAVFSPGEDARPGESGSCFGRRRRLLRGLRLRARRRRSANIFEQQQQRPRRWWCRSRVEQQPGRSLRPRAPRGPRRPRHPHGRSLRRRGLPWWRPRRNRAQRAPPARAQRGTPATRQSAAAAAAEQAGPSPTPAAPPQERPTAVVDDSRGPSRDHPPCRIVNQ
mmetsp:Transcript_14843/g.59461  ORF Transcript_14843/g.59461 Transcript_14843/m.59461 type:complete len:202 (+) Transcript_14843:423-1028(+)